MKKLVVFLVCLMLFASSVISGCSGNSAVETTKAPDTGSVASTTDAPEKTPVIRVSVVDSWYAQAPYSDDLPIFKELQKRTGVDIQWECLPDDQYWSMMKVRVAAATDLPDLFTLPDDAKKLGEQGIIIKLNELIDKHAPDYKKVLEECLPLKQITVQDDGSIYAIATYSAGLFATNPNAPLLIRKDWLKKVGMDVPKNADDLYKVLKAFKDQNVNGNGDVIPLSLEITASSGMYGLDSLYDLSLNMDGRYSAAYYPDGNNNYVNQFTRPEAKEYFMWLSKLYKDGLLDKEFSQQNDDTLISKISNNKVGVVKKFIADVTRYNEACRQAGDANAEWYATEPLVAMNGKQQYVIVGGVDNVYPLFGISKDCKNPEAVLKVFNYFGYSKEGYMLSRFGIEGLSYTKDADGKIHFTDYVVNNPDKLSIVQAMWSLGGNANLPICYATPDIKSLYLDQTPYIEKDPIQADALNRLAPYIQASKAPALQFTSEETAELQTFVTDCTTYRDTELVKFVMGLRDFAEWDKFISDWKKMGLEREEKIVQAAYGRFVK